MTSNGAHKHTYQGALCKISGFHHEADENCTLPCCYAASSSNILPVSILEPLKKGMIGCPKMSVKNYYYLLHNNPEERSSQLPWNSKTQQSTFLTFIHQRRAA
jgi:hypothetical protein